MKCPACGHYFALLEDGRLGEHYDDSGLACALARSGGRTIQPRVAVLPGMDKLEADSFRDCVRDVLAMVEVHLAMDDVTADQVAIDTDLRVLFANADLAGCARVAVPMLAAAWKTLTELRARSCGTDPRAELDAIFVLFRQELG